MSAPMAAERRYLLAEFREPERLVAAARAGREAGWRGLDLFSPYPLHGADEALGLRRSWVPLLALIGGLTGMVGGFVMQWWTNEVSYPINVANRLHAAPAYVPITFELAVLASALCIFFGLLGLSRLPQPYHAAFELDAFRSQSTDGFWLTVEVEPGEPAERRTELTQALERLGAARVDLVTEAAAR